MFIRLSAVHAKDALKAVGEMGNLLKGVSKTLIKLPLNKEGVNQ